MQKMREEYTKLCFNQIEKTYIQISSTQTIMFT